MPNALKATRFLGLSRKQVLPFVPEFHICRECHTHVTADSPNYFLICSSSLLLLIRFMIYVRFSRFSLCSIIFSVFLKLCDVQPLLILTTDFQKYLLICLTHLRLLVFSGFHVSKSSHLCLGFIFSCECLTHVTADLQN